MRHRYVVIEFDAVPPLLGLIFDHISHKLFSTRDHTCNPYRSAQDSAYICKGKLTDTGPVYILCKLTLNHTRGT